MTPFAPIGRCTAAPFVPRAVAQGEALVAALPATSALPGRRWDTPPWQVAGPLHHLPTMTLPPPGAALRAMVAGFHAGPWHPTTAAWVADLAATPDTEVGRQRIMREWAGFVAGLQGAPCPALPAPPLLAAVADRLQSWDVDGSGGRSDATMAVRAALLTGATQVWDNTTPPPYVGRAMSGLAKLGQAEWVDRAQTVTWGTRLATYWQSQEALALVGHLPRSVVQQSLHRREIGAVLIRRGWVHGMVERLQGNGEHAVAEVLAANQGSVIHRALASGQLDYPATVIAALPGMLTTMRDGIAACRTTAPAVAEVLAANQGSVIARALHSGQLDYPATVVAILQKPAAWRALWAAQVAALQVADAQAAAILEHDAARILAYALQEGHLTPAAAIDGYYRI